VSLIALCSATGAPGVTTTALALGWVWPLVHPDRRVLVVDADVAGSGPLPGLLHADVPAGNGVLALAAERTGLTPDSLIEQVLALDPSGQRLLLTGITDPTQARTLGSVWTGLVDVAPELAGAGIDVVVDLGRLGHRYEPTVLVEQADVAAVVLRSTLPSVTGATSALRSLRETRGPASMTTAVLIGEGDPYTSREIARELHVDPLPTVAMDAWAAQVLSTGGATGWRFDRSPLLRGARGLAASLHALINSLGPVVRS